MWTDILENTHYTRIIDDATTKIAEPLNQLDTVVKVVNGDKLADPDLAGNNPGVIFVNNERITYWEKSGNELKNIRRGTMGTSIPFRHYTNDLVIDSSSRQNIPGGTFNVDQYLSNGGTVRALETNTSYSINDVVSFENRYYKVYIGFTSNTVKDQLYNDLSNMHKAGTVWYDINSTTDSLQYHQTQQAKFLNEFVGTTPLINIAFNQDGRYLANGYVSENYVQINE